MASLRQKFHLVDNGLMAHVQSVGSEESAEVGGGGGWGGGGWMSVFIQRSARVLPVSATSEQMCN